MWKFLAVLGWSIILFLGFVMGYPWIVRWAKSIWANIKAWIAKKILSGMMGGGKR
jgi:hypothetical protein